MPDNKLYFGDNLDILYRYLSDESVDLIYLDPPFKSSQDYNILFAEQNGARSAAQIKAFEDTWEWNQAFCSFGSSVGRACRRRSWRMPAASLGNPIRASRKSRPCR